MRIIGGKHKGRKIHAPQNLPARPTKDITKESLFNILKNRFFLNEIRVLDLFSGTGNIAFEFASRGSMDITAVDKHPGSVKFIEKTAARLGMPIHVIHSPAEDFLRYPPSAPYDVIFMDPPYDFDKEKLEKIIDTIFQNAYLSSRGLLILEHHKNLRFDHSPFYKRSKTYGQSVLSFFENS